MEQLFLEQGAQHQNCKYLLIRARVAFQDIENIS